MRRPHLVIAALSAAALSACASAEPPPPAPPPVVTVPPVDPAPPPPAPPALLVVPRAEASPRRGPGAKSSEVPELRSDGKRHVLRRTADGVLVISADRGVMGFVKAPSPIRWAGLVEEDAVLVAAGDTLFRAATPDDAIAGKLDALGHLDPAATILASGGKIVVAAAAGPDGAYLESRDGGRHFSPGKRPAKGNIVDLAVRSDGVIVAAIERGSVTDSQGRRGVRAQIHVSRREGAWTPGPVADTFYGPEISQRGDAIVVQSRQKKGDDLDTLGLDAGGRWIPTDFPDEWLAFTWTGDRVSISAPTDRPGFPKRGKGGMSMLGVLGGMREQCRGLDCLAHRSVVASTPGAEAFSDGVCAKEHVQKHTETIPVLDGPGKSHDEESTTYSCDPKAPAQRASTLLVRAGAERHVAKLPLTCATGRITGSERGSFVYCSAEHQGRASILHVSPAGAITEIASGIVGDLDILGSETASDGTTLIYAGKAGWVCTAAGAPSCKAVPYDRFLAARPLPEGRALVARRAGARELELSLFGEAGATPVQVAVSDNVLDLEVTAEGHVRLWTSRTQTWMATDPKQAAKIEAFLVRSDGQLVADSTATR